MLNNMLQMYFFSCLYLGVNHMFYFNMGEREPRSTSLTSVFAQHIRRSNLDGFSFFPFSLSLHTHCHIVVYAHATYLPAVIWSANILVACNRTGPAGRAVSWKRERVTCTRNASRTANCRKSHESRTIFCDYPQYVTMPRVTTCHRTRMLISLVSRAMCSYEEKEEKSGGRKKLTKDASTIVVQSVIYKSSATLIL